MKDQKIFELLKDKDENEYINIDSKNIDEKEYLLLLQKKEPFMLLIAEKDGKAINFVKEKEIGEKVFNEFIKDSDTYANLEKFIKK